MSESQTLTLTALAVVEAMFTAQLVALKPAGSAANRWIFKTNRGCTQGKVGGRRAGVRRSLGDAVRCVRCGDVAASGYS